MPKRTTNPLDDRMAALEATDIEVGALIERDPAEVFAWRHGEAEIDADAAIRLRAFMAPDPGAARAALVRIRRTFIRTWEGDHAAQSTTTETVGPTVRDGARTGALVPGVGGSK